MHAALRLFVFLALAIRLACAALVLPSTAGPVNPVAAVAVLEDKSGQLTLADAMQSTAFRPAATGGNDINLGYSHSVYWLKLTLDTHAAPGRDWLLEVGYPSLDHVELFQPYSGRADHAGDRQPFAKRPVPHRNFVFPLALPDSGTATIYLRVRSEGNLTVPLRLWEAKRFQWHNQDLYALLALYYGMLLALGLYNLLLFLSLRDRLYLCYVAFVASMAIGQLSLNGLGNQYLWPDWPAWGHVALSTGFALTGFFGALFTRLFLNTRQIAPRWDSLIVVLMAAFMLAALGPAFMPYQWSAILTSLAGASFAAVAVIVGVVCLYRRQPGARYFLLAWTLLLIGVGMQALRNLAWLPTNALTSHTMQIGSALEMLLLSFALADRIHVLRREKELAQTEMLATREATLATLRAHEQELEQRVDERTRALTEANARLAASEAQLLELAHHDQLTGLPNRLLLNERVSHAIVRAQRSRTLLALLLVDLDRFKPVNDHYGHAAGDCMLQAVARAMQGAVRASDTVARLGGDEFVVLLENLQDAVDVERLADQLNAAVAAAHEAAGIPQAISASIGIALYPTHGDDVTTLLRRADEAMYHAKEIEPGSWFVARG